jgi:Zn-dependent protease
MNPLSIVIYIAILLFSVIFHEVAHGLMADRLGDPTARFAGRLTLNPIPHIDLFGSILLPALLIYFHAPFPGIAVSGGGHKPCLRYFQPFSNPATGWIQNFCITSRIHRPQSDVLDFGI